MTLPYLNDWTVLLGVLTAFLVCVAWLAASAALHRRTLSAVPIRIHISGSRGKTTTARQIGAALRAGGLRVLTKTTGTVPILIGPDGREERWRRWGSPSISEQERFFRRARRLKADAVVLESMAIEPEYLWASETYLVRATHAVITNVRPDHEEVLGHAKGAVAEALSLMVPTGGRLFLSEEAAVEPILSRAKRLATGVEVVRFGDLLPEESNRALTHSVCASLGMAETQVNEGIAAAGEDPGAFFIASADISGQPIHFHNAFACNDPESFMRLWQAHPPRGPATVILNARFDRPERTRTFLEVVALLDPPVELVLLGQLAMRWVTAAGIPPARVHRFRQRDPAELLRAAAALSPGGIVWGVGNYADMGERLTGYARELARPC